MAIILRGRITKDGKIELIDPLPDDVDTEQEVSVRIGEQPTVYETVNEYGDRVIVDEIEGIISPVDPMTMGAFMNSSIIGIWDDHKDEMVDGLTWVKKMREEELERNDPWQGRMLSDDEG